MRIQGISGSRGVAVGNVYRYIQEEIVIPDYTVAEDKVEAEIGKFASAMAATLKQLDTIRQKALKDMGPEESHKTHPCLMVLNPLLRLAIQMW